MRFINLIMLYDFIHVLHRKSKPYTKNENLTKPIQFTTIYLLLEQKLIPNNYYDQKINMIYFIQANGHDINMHANIHGMNMYEIL
jgi:hypothetical protein